MCSLRMTYKLQMKLKHEENEKARYTITSALSKWELAKIISLKIAYDV